MASTSAKFDEETLTSLKTLLWGTDLKDEVFKRWTQGNYMYNLYLPFWVKSTFSFSFFIFNCIHVRYIYFFSFFAYNLSLIHSISSDFSKLLCNLGHWSHKKHCCCPFYSVYVQCCNRPFHCNCVSRNFLVNDINSH